MFAYIMPPPREDVKGGETFQTPSCLGEKTGLATPALATVQQPSEEEPSRDSISVSWEQFLTVHSDNEGTIRATLWSLGFEADQKADTVNATASWKWQSYRVE